MLQAAPSSEQPLIFHRRLSMYLFEDLSWSQLFWHLLTETPVFLRLSSIVALVIFPIGSLCFLSCSYYAAFSQKCPILLDKFLGDIIEGAKSLGIACISYLPSCFIYILFHQLNSETDLPLLNSIYWLLVSAPGLFVLLLASVYAFSLIDDLICMIQIRRSIIRYFTARWEIPLNTDTDSISSNHPFLPE